MKKSILVILSLTLVALLIYMMKSEKTAQTVSLQKGESYIEGLRLLHRQNGAVDWILTARRADIGGKGDEAYLSGIEMKIEDKGITVYADKGLYDMNARNLVVDGKVMAKADSYSITTEGVKFDNAGQMLKTDGRVRLDARKFSVEGTGMEADNTAQTVRILKNVKAVFHN